MKTTESCKSYRSILILVLMIMITGCHVGQPSKVGYLLPNMVFQRYMREKVFFTERIASLGGEAIVESANDDDKLQVQQAHDLIEHGVGLLVVDPVNLYSAAEIVRVAHEKGIKVIAYDRLICNSDLDYYLSFDNEKVGELMATYVINKVPEGNYIIFAGDKRDLNAGFVKSGQLKALDPSIKSGKIKIDYNIFVEDWSGENASHELKRYLDLTGEQPAVILSSSDQMSYGIIETLKAYGMAGKVLVTGQDAELTACQNIIKGYQVMTVYKPLKKLAYTAAELSIKIIKNQSITETTSKIFNGNKEVPSILLDPVSVDKDNLKSTVIADGYLSETDIYKQ